MYSLDDNHDFEPKTQSGVLTCVFYILLFIWMAYFFDSDNRFVRFKVY